MSDRVLLVKLGETDLVLADPEDDIRGRTVVDTDGEKFGKVDGLFLDHDEGKVRLLQVVDGGFLGLGKESRLVPVELVRKLDADQVVIDRHRQAVVDAPGYDPELTDAPDYDDIYRYYDVGPWWGTRPFG
ncbi:sporulation protein YlmC with PRC-barrel domain [Kribbella sp. VKM Ac-2527]|uniref:Sporulation protein YlmC with PRC-barrel domain n=1 Tax=Kribbella caucasensis TaxID=2512215 RepID=A0A4R6K6B0_9ACTN|nr:PRC-barrel domain-containing protein [Kribbella sp. VKM Ac-2527]TDO44082.1 sporulation protein YlmC with PRC-barrel domain [Kribbella sp. VKM Ac-2527]